ncbi:hypothetical protein FH972_027372 [Carpinus fangiana]|uniref:Uncharacterized protein n=1 Tax=Carpinus fangiana TaxID=176857 RepID=A0A5N6Q9R2_9ROSI|nr:hypothetical protein FH972_027372 [Carpinus fangiana]
MKTSTIKGEDKLTQQVNLSRKAHFCALWGLGSRVYGMVWVGSAGALVAGGGRRRPNRVRRIRLAGWLTFGLRGGGQRRSLVSRGASW